MNLDLTTQELRSVEALEANSSRHIAAVNDIYSFEKEAETAQSCHPEGGALCSSVRIVALETGVGTKAAKRILWTMCREWELCQKELAANCMGQDGLECSNALRDYILGLEYQMSGNELWSSSTARYRYSSA